MLTEEQMHSGMNICSVCEAGEEEGAAGIEGTLAPMNPAENY